VLVRLSHVASFIVNADHCMMVTAEKWEWCARNTAQAGAKKKQWPGSSPRIALIAFAVK